MRIDRAFVGWGLFFILVGAIPLAVNGGALTRDQVVDWWRFWPLILVGIGLGLILRKTPFDAVGGLLIATASGLMVGSLLAAGVTGFPGEFCGQAERAVSFPSQSGALFEDAEIELDLDCGDMTVTTQTGPGWSVEGEDRTPGGPEIRSDAALLVVRSADGERGPLDFVGRHTTWRIGLPTIPVSASTPRSTPGRRPSTSPVRASTSSTSRRTPGARSWTSAAPARSTRSRSR